jgi:hypothetical protein
MFHRAAPPVFGTVDGVDHTSPRERSRRSVQRDLADSARTGAPPLGHLAGLHRVQASGQQYALAFDLSRPAMVGGPGLFEVVMLADLALGGAIRDRVGPHIPMPTLSMSMVLAPGRLREVAYADGECTTVSRSATSRSRLCTAAGEVVGNAQGLFALPALPYRGPSRAMPWDSFDDVAPAPRDEATSRDREGVVEAIAAHAAGPSDRAWGTSHHAAQLSTGVPRQLTPTALMVNRLGHVQGGSLLTAAVLAAAGHGFPVDALAGATIDFVDAAHLDDAVLAGVDVHRVGGRTMFTSVTLGQRGRTCCHVTAVFRR